MLNIFGPRFVNGYGQGECPCTITSMNKSEYRLDLADDVLTSVGTARTGVELRIVDEAGLACGTGKAGEIIVRSDVVMRGYWRNPEATAATIVDGWLHTGDLGMLDERGFLTLLDRSKDLIISGGSNIYPTEVEQVLRSEPSVLEVAVVGQPDQEWGENVVAFVVPRSPQATSPDALDRWCLDNLARFKRPKRYVFVDELPRNSTGKILKNELRKLIVEES